MTGKLHLSLCAMSAVVVLLANAELRARSPQGQSQAAPGEDQASRTIRVRGRVLGPLGDPIANAEVWCPLRGGAKRGVVRTDKRGRYVLDKLPFERLMRIHATGAGHSVGRAWARPGNRNRATVDLRLWSAADIRGAVVDESGKPIAGVDLTASFDIARGFGFDPQATATSSDDGSFTLERVPLGYIHVRAFASGYAMATHVVDLSVDTKVAVILKRTKSRKASVRITGEDGKPVKGAKIRILPYANGSHQVLPRPLREGVTDAEGRWSVEGYPANLELRISASFAGYAMKPSTIRVQAEAQPGANPLGGVVRIASRRPGDRESAEGLQFVAHVAKESSIQLRGRVVDADGKPIANQRLECRRPNRRNGRFATTGSDGRFVIACPEAPGERVGIYLLDTDYAVDFPEAAGTRRRSSRPPRYFECNADPEAQYAIRAVLGARIRGRVVTDVGLPARNQSLEVQDFKTTRRPMWFPILYRRTDARGEFDIRAIHPQAGSVRVESSGNCGTGVSKEIALHSGLITQDLEIVVPSPGKVVGRVVDAQGRALAGTRVQLITYDPQTGQQRDGSVLEVYSDREGRFAHLDVAVGHYRALVYVGNERFFGGSNSEPFEVQSGKTTDLKKVEASK